MFVEAQEGTSTLCGVCRLIQIGVSFLWDASGAHLKMPQSLGGEWVQLEIRNGLPFLDFTQYKRLRPLLTRNWKETCMSAASPCASEEPLGEPDVVSWEDIAELARLQEEAEPGGHAAQMVRQEPEGEAEARALLDQPGPLNHVDVANVIRAVKLQPTITNRKNKVSNPESKLKIWVFGSWVQGGLHGITKITLERPCLARLLGRFMRKQTDNPFLSIAVSEDVVFKPHKDPNDGNIPNTLLGISSYTGGELWLEDDETAPANDQEHATTAQRRTRDPERS